MADEFLRDAERALEDHGAFGATDDGFVVTTTPFDASVTLREGDEGIRYVIEVTAPTLDAAVEGEVVADVVQEGWFETFERRITAVGGVTHVEPETPTVEANDGKGDVRVTIAFETGIAARGAEDAKALVDFVEGTYLQGVVPGYDYREPVSGLLQRAEDASDGTGRPKL